VEQEESALTGTLEAVRASLAVARAPSLDWVQELLAAVRADEHAAPPRPQGDVDEATTRMRGCISPLMPRDSARAILDAYRALHADGESLAFFLGQQEYASVMLLYRQLHDRVVTMHQALESVGLRPYSEI
jgi:hypothetical protein